MMPTLRLRHAVLAALLATLSFTPSVSAQLSALPRQEPDPAADDDLAGLTDADAAYRAAASRASTKPRVNGVLDDEAWVDAQLITGFTQAQPTEGAPATERTEVRVMFDGDTLYIGAQCYDRDPAAIVAGVLRRDQRLDNDDTFTVTLDTYHDHRSGFYFEVNPLGAKFDAQIDGEGGTSLMARLRGDGFNANWDAVWEAAAQVNSDGWAVEIAIPFWSLRFDPQQVGAWGLNFRRTIRRHGELDYWAPVPRQYDATRLSMSGMLTGLEGLARPRNLQFKPYAIGSVGQVATGELTSDGSLEHASDNTVDAGLDFKWGVNPNVTLDATVNPDFSQVEADDEQINLTRFSLFFPEKREFFLENAGIFEFGTGAGVSRGGGGGSVVGFHSRSIGISADNRELPLYGGGRLTGKIGGWSLGLLSMQSRSQEAASSNNFSVLRARRDLGARSSIGVLATNRQAGGDDYNRELGVDGRWALNANTTVDAWWMKTTTPGLDGGDWAGQMRFDWGTPTWQWEGSALQVGEEFNPEMGFADRVGIRHYQSTVHWTPYPEANWIRNHSPHVSAAFTTDLDGRLLSRLMHYDWDTYLRRGDKVSVAYNASFELLDRPFEIAEGVVIPPGEYHWSEVNFELTFDPSRPLSAGLNYTTGDFWSGTRHEIRANAALRFGARFSTNLSWTRNDVELLEGDFTTDLFRARINVDFSTRLSLAGLVQYNSQADQLLSNFRLNFIHTEGADLFLVYNERRLAEDSDLIDRALVLKATHLLRF